MGNVGLRPWLLASVLACSPKAPVDEEPAEGTTPSDPSGDDTATEGDDTGTGRDDTGTTGDSGTTGDTGTQTTDPGVPTDCAIETCHYVRAGSSGEGASWDAALGDLPDDLERGATYFVAAGTYGSPTLDDPEDGERVITIKRAVVGDHGTDVGWSDDLAEGPATFSGFTMVSDHYVVDGKRRNEADWSDVEAYGLRVIGGFQAHTINFGRGSNHVVVRYVDVGGPESDSFDPSIPDAGFYFGGFGEILTDWTISGCHVHNVYLPFQLASASAVTIEESWLGPNWSKETIRGQIHASDIVIRHNVFHDGCQGTPGDPTAGGCTAQIAMWDGESEGDFDGSEIYGNLIRTTQETHHSDGCVLIGGDGHSAVGVSANHVRVYNNTFAGVHSGLCLIRMPGTTEGNEVLDNVWVDLAPDVVSGCTADVCEHNEVLASDAFVDAAGGDFRPAAATEAGAILAAPYDTDRFGNARGADGTWDIGAYEFVE
jgi:hypothetical protein